MLKKKMLLGIIFFLLIGFTLLVWLFIQMGTNSKIDSIADFNAKDYTIGLMIGVISVGYPIYLAYFKKK